MGFLYRCRCAVDTRGNVFLLDYREKTIYKYDPDLAFVKAFGRSGEGPGEMALPLFIEIDPEGNVVIYDVGSRHFTVFDNAGTLVRTLDFKQIGFNQVQEFRIAPDGMFYLEIREPDFTGEKGGDNIRIVRFAPDLTDEADIVSERVNDYVHISEGSTLITEPVPFVGEIYWDVAPSGEIVVATSGDYTITVFSPALETLNIVRHKGVRVKVTDEDKEDWFSHIGHGPDDSMDHLRRTAVFPKYKPYFGDFRIAPDGFIIVFTYETEGESPVCDMFDLEGEFVGQCTLPSFLTRAVFQNGFVYRWKGYDDEAEGQLYSLERYRLE